jgi:hypothetical protein
MIGYISDAKGEGSEQGQERRPRELCRGLRQEVRGVGIRVR